MKTKTKKRLLVSTLVMLILLISACSKSNDSSSSNSPGNNGDANSAAQKITFLAAPSGDIVDLKTNSFTKLVEEKFGLNINWNITTGADMVTKQNLMLASGDYPEVIWNGNFSPSDILKYSKQGLIVPLNDYLDKYAPNFKKALDDAPGLKAASIAPDGKIYGIPNYNWCYHCYWMSKFWINTKYLDELGLKMPTTTAEFESVLQAFKEKGYVPLTGAIDGNYPDPTTFLMNAFVYDDRNTYFNVNDGQLSFAPVSDEWKAGLSYINGLYAKGLIDHSAYTQKWDDLNKQLQQKKVAAFSTGGSFFILPQGTANPDYKYWKTVPPLKGPGGVQYAAFYGNGPGGATFVVTNKATEEQKIALAKLLDYIYSPEGTQTLDFGPEGKYWKKADASEVGLNGQTALFQTDFGAFYANGAKQNEGWNQMGPIFQSATWRNGQAATSADIPEGQETMLHLETLKNYTGKQPAQVYPGAIWISEEENQKYSMIRTNINKYVNEWMAQFIVGSKSIDKSWEEYKNGLNKLGLDEYLKLSQQYMGKPFDTSAFAPDSQAVAALEALK